MKLMTIENYLKNTFNPNEEYNIRQPLTCADGFWIDVQGGTRGHYCEPRQHINQYNKVEISCEFDPLIEQYQDGDSGIYAFVPIDIVERLALKHGGIIQ